LHVPLLNIVVSNLCRSMSSSSSSSSSTLSSPKEITTQKTKKRKQEKKVSDITTNKQSARVSILRLKSDATSSIEDLSAPGMSSLKKTKRK